MTTLDFYTVTEAFAVASGAFRAAGHTDLAEYYLRARDRITPEIATLLSENSHPVAASVSERTEAKQTTPPAKRAQERTFHPSDVAAFLGRPVSRIRDQGGPVLLAWIDGLGCRFVSRRKLLAFVASS